MNHYTDEATPITSGTVTSPAYFEDVIGQKNAQIHFLQQQLDNRIHQQHLADQGLSEMTEQLSVAKAANDQLAEALHIRDGELAETRHQLAVLENDYNELCRQNEILGTSASDSRDMVTLLQDKIDMQQTEMLRISQAAERKAEILSKMHDELGRLLEGPGKETVPVLAVAG